MTNVTLKSFEQALELACKIAELEGYTIRPAGFMNDFNRTTCPIGALNMNLGYREPSLDATGPVSYCAEQTGFTKAQIWSFVMGFDNCPLGKPIDDDYANDEAFWELGYKFRQRYYIDTSQPVKAPKGNSLGES